MFLEVLKLIFYYPLPLQLIIIDVEVNFTASIFIHFAEGCRCSFLWPLLRYCCSGFFAVVIKGRNFETFLIFPYFRTHYKFRQCKPTLHNKGYNQNSIALLQVAEVAMAFCTHCYPDVISNTNIIKHINTKFHSTTTPSNLSQN